MPDPIAWVSAAAIWPCFRGTRASRSLPEGILTRNPSRNAVVGTITLARLPSYHFLVIRDVSMPLFATLRIAASSYPQLLLFLDDTMISSHDPRGKMAHQRLWEAFL
jgi:uncharacterized protein (DUF1800 family)